MHIFSLHTAGHLIQRASPYPSSSVIYVPISHHAAAIPIPEAAVKASEDFQMRTVRC